MMMTIGQVTSDDKILILGASGGVGTGALLLAKMAGAEVVVCASSDSKMEKLKSLGADHAMTYMNNEFHKEFMNYMENLDEGDLKAGSLWSLTSPEVIHGFHRFVV